MNSNSPSVRVEDRPILYVGDAFRVTDRKQIFDWIAKHNLATLVTTGIDDWPRATTSPVVVQYDTDGAARVYGHIDRRNPQSVHLRERRRALLVCHGPRAYVSPGWYRRRPASPTVLHITVHVRGYPSVLDDQAAASLLLSTVGVFEPRLPRPWSYDGGARFLEESAGRITGYELVVEGIDAACKLSQDRSVEERMLIAAELENSTRSDDRLIAAMLHSVDAPLD